MNNEESPNSIEFYRDQVTRVVPASGKIYDITHADTNEHSVPLPTGYPANTRAILVHGNRVSGSGVLYCRSTSGAGDHRTVITNNTTGLWFRAVDGLFYYLLTIANDDWDITAVGYIAGAA